MARNRQTKGKQPGKNAPACGDDRQRTIARWRAPDNRRLRQARGGGTDRRNPLTDKEAEEKFEALAGPVMAREARRRAIDAIWNLEKQSSVSELMSLFSVAKAAPDAAELSLQGTSL